MAWLHARPKISKNDTDPKSRIELYSEDSPMRKMPDADKMLVSSWHELGLVSSSGMAVSPLSWQEIDSFCKRSNTELTGWESKQLRQMSANYCSFSKEADKQGCQPPYSADLNADDLQKHRDSISNKFKMMFRKS